MIQCWKQMRLSLERIIRIGEKQQERYLGMNWRIKLTMCGVLMRKARRGACGAQADTLGFGSMEAIWRSVVFTPSGRLCRSRPLRLLLQEPNKLDNESIRSDHTGRNSGFANVYAKEVARHRYQSRSESTHLRRPTSQRWPALWTRSLKACWKAFECRMYRTNFTWTQWWGLWNSSCHSYDQGHLSRRAYIQRWVHSQLWTPLCSNSRCHCAPWKEGGIWTTQNSWLRKIESGSRTVVMLPLFTQY